jgi:hypothetical protein
VNQLAAWSANGTPLPGFPVTGLDAINCQTIIADLDGDDQVELLNDDNTGNGTFHAYNHDGSVWTWPGWPLTLTGQPFYMNPFVADLDRNGTLEMVVSSSVSTPATSYAYIYTTYVEFDSTQAYTSMLQFNPWHDGTFGSSGTTGIKGSPGIAPQLSVLPNPSSGEVRIEVPCAGAGPVHVAIMDIHGQIIVEFDRMASNPGVIACAWDGSNERGSRVKPGIYLIRAVQGASLFTGRSIRLP